MFDESGAFIFGRRTYDVTDGWNGAHRVNGVPLFVSHPHAPPPETVPRDRRTLPWFPMASPAPFDRRAQ